MRVRTRKEVFVLVVCAVLMAAQKAEAFIFLSEILADPASGLAGDASGDGIRSSSKDEFVEIFNSGTSSVDMTGWYLNDSVSTRHVFSQNTLLNSNQYFVVFGGADVNLSDVNWQTATSGSLGLNNGGDTVSLFDAENQLIDEINYGSIAGNDESIVRSPRAPNGELVRHSGVSELNSLFSPGVSANPIVIEDEIPLPIEDPGIPISETNTVPEPSTLITFLIAGAGLAMKKRFG